MAPPVCVLSHDGAPAGEGQARVPPNTLPEHSPVKVQEDGLTLLHEPSKIPILADVIFVHGLQGHPRKTWQVPAGVEGSPELTQKRSRFSRLFGSKCQLETDSQEPASTFWPEDLLPADRKDVRILTYGYDSRVTHYFKGPANKLNLSQHGEALLNRVAGERQRSGCAGRPIIFVAHSLGGLLVKEALVEARKQAHHTGKLDVFNSTQAIIFFGTPHSGSNDAQWGLLLSTIVSAAFDTNKTILRTLDPDDERLDKLARDFQDILDGGKLRIGSLIESAGITGLPVFKGKVVPDFSSSFASRQYEHRDYINGNHVNMCRFSSAEDSGYIRFKDALTFCMQDIKAPEQGISAQAASEGAEARREQQGLLDAAAKECLESLFFQDYKNRMMNITEANPDTCEWIWSHPKFRDWLSAEHSGILLVSGKPGCGKSVLAKYVQARLSTEPEVRHWRSLASFFFNGRGKEIEQITSGMIRALLYQIFTHRPALIRQLPLMKNYEELEKSGNSHVEWPLDVLRSLLLSLRNMDDGTIFYLVIDSLDEAKAGGTATEVVGLLKQLGSSNASCKFKIFITSRPLTFLQKLPDSPYPRISLEKLPDSQYVENDIEGYISHKVITELTRFGEHLKPITEKLRHGSNGVFLWVDLVMKRLIDEGEHGLMIPALEEIVEEMPNGEGMEGMENLYRNILSRLDKGRARTRRIMLQWVLYAERPLTVEEFRIAIVMNCHPSRYRSEDALIKETNMGDFKLWVESHCGGLVEFTENMVVQLIHQSAKDYLLKYTHDWLVPMNDEPHSCGSAQSQLAMTCLAYLSFDVFLEGPTEDIIWFEASPKYNDRLQHHRLLKYAALHWSKHLDISPESIESIESLCHQVCELAKTTSKALLFFQVSRFERHGKFSGGELLHLVSELGHETVVKLLLEKDTDVEADSKDWDGRTPLSWAAGSGHEAVVKLLLARPDVGANSKDWDGQTPLSWAAERGHEAVVKLLLAWPDVEADSKDWEYGQTPLSWAAGRGHEAVVKLLLARPDVEPDSKDSNGRTPLSWAAEGGHEAVVRLLLRQPDVEADSKDRGGRPSLSWAAEREHGAVVKLLTRK